MLCCVVKVLCALLTSIVLFSFQFAVAQYSFSCRIHVDFTSHLNTDDIMDISQVRGGTYTGRAINKLV